MRYISIIILIVLFAPVKAQIKGIVKDKSGEPILSANVHWQNTTNGTITSDDGTFSINRSSKSDKLIVSYMGFISDTIIVENNAPLDITLQKDGLVLNEVQVSARKMGTLKLSKGALNAEMITSTELLRAACCNLGESFTTNPSVDVSYSDAATGAKQIKLLGLSGTYVQMLTENIPNYRGAASPYSLGYVPGPWMQSIQVSKGSSSVKNGYEAIAGQINIEFKKPQAPNSVSANLFATDKERYEANADANIHLTKRLSTGLLLHYENETKTHDDNGDGFLDLPRVEQYNIQNRWAYMGDHYVFQAAIKALKEDRKSGQDPHLEMEEESEMSHDLYTIGIDTKRYEAFTKNAYIFDKESSTNLALILSGSIHNMDAAFGNKFYNVDQKNAYASLMFETEFTKKHSLSTGLSYNYDYYDQDYSLSSHADHPAIKEKVKESVPGAYAQYTYNLDEKLVLMGGIRADYSSLYHFFVTPRMHVKYNPNEYVNFRLSAGKGYRSTHPLAENNYLLASSRKVVIDQDLEQEQAWNYGASILSYIPLFGKTLNLSAEYYYTDFKNQLVIDLDSDPHQIHFSNLKGDSYSHVLQLEASYPIFEGFTLTTAYRLMNVKTTYDNQLMEKPLTGKYKGLVSASYQTDMGKWQFDATLQLNGGGRMPNAYTLSDGSQSWNSRYKAYEQVSAQVTRFFRNWSIYIGGENMTNFKQKNPIIAASDPWGSNFDSSMIWGPVHGSIYYAGIRVNFE